MLAYAMTYITLTLMLLGLTGTTLHLVLQTSQNDQRLFQNLARIRDVELAIREDARQADHIRISDDEAEFTIDSDTVVWKVTGHRIVREQFQGDNRSALMTAVFRRATQLEFVTQSELLFALRITPATTLAHRKTSALPNAPVHPVEILLPRPTDDRLSLTDRLGVQPSQSIRTSS